MGYLVSSEPTRDEQRPPPLSNYLSLGCRETAADTTQSSAAISAQSISPRRTRGGRTPRECLGGGQGEPDSKDTEAVRFGGAGEVDASSGSHERRPNT